MFTLNYQSSEKHRWIVNAVIIFSSDSYCCYLNILGQSNNLHAHLFDDIPVLLGNYANANTG